MGIIIIGPPKSGWLGDYCTFKFDELIYFQLNNYIETLAIHFTNSLLCIHVYNIQKKKTHARMPTHRVTHVC